MIGFGEFSKRKYEIEDLEKISLLKIDTTISGFYDKVLKFTSENEEIKNFIKAVKEVDDTKLGQFWIPIYSPSLQGDSVTFKKGKKPAVGYSFFWWKETVRWRMPKVEEKKWQIGTEYQYYAFLVYLINSLISNGWKPKKAIESIVLDSRKLGHYYDSKKAKKTHFELTGSREVCGVFDLANTTKYLSCTNNTSEEINIFWIAGGSYCDSGRSSPLANLIHYDSRNFEQKKDDKEWFKIGDPASKSVAWLVLLSSKNSR